MGVAAGVVIDSLVVLAVVADGRAAGQRRQLLLGVVVVVVLVVVLRGRRRRRMSLVMLGVGRLLTTRHHRRRTGPMGSGMCRFLLTEVRVAAAATVAELLLLLAAGALVGPGRRQGPRGAAGAAAPMGVAGRPRVLVPLHAHGLVQSAKLRVRIGCVRPGQKGCTRPASACRADRFSPQENRVPASQRESE